MMKFLRIAAALLAFSLPAFAQPVGQLPAGSVWGNSSTSRAPASAVVIPSCTDTSGKHLNYISGTGFACGTGLGNAIIALTGDVVATGPGTVAATIQTNVVTYAKFQQVAASSLVGNPTGSLANSQGITLGSTLAFSGTALQTGAGTGDVSWSANSFVTTLATVNSNVGTFGSATQSVQFTVNGKGLITAAANVTVTPAVGSITGLGTGVATALGVNVGSAGAFVTFNGAGGTPSSMVGTNITGTASGLTAGNVTTNANLTGVITSSGNATSIASQTGTGTKFVVDTSPAINTPTIAGGTISGLTGLAIRDTSAAFDVTFAATSTSATLTAGRTITWDVGNVAHTVKLGTTANTITFPNLASFTVITNGDTGTVTNAMLAGSIAASKLVGTDIATVGTLTAGTASTGFTINAASVTLSGQFPGSGVAVVANASGSPSATFGVMKADGTTITCSSGTCSAVGGVATAITVGTTTVNSGTNNYVLTAGTGTLANVTIASLLTQGNGILVTGTTNAGIAVDKATNSNAWSATSNKVITGDILNNAGNKQALTDGASVAVDMSLGVNFSLLFTTHGGTRTLSNPTNTQDGRTGCFWITQDATGGEGLTLGTSWMTGSSGGVTLSSGANATDLLCYIVQDSTHVSVAVSQLNTKH